MTKIRKGLSWLFSVLIGHASLLFSKTGKYFQLASCNKKPLRIFCVFLNFEIWKKKDLHSFWGRRKFSATPLGHENLKIFKSKLHWQFFPAASCLLQNYLLHFAKMFPALVRQLQSSLTFFAAFCDKNTRPPKMSYFFFFVLSWRKQCQKSNRCVYFSLSAVYGTKKQIFFPRLVECGLCVCAVQILINL